MERALGILGTAVRACAPRCSNCGSAIACAVGTALVRVEGRGAVARVVMP